MFQWKVSLRDRLAIPCTLWLLEHLPSKATGQLMLSGMELGLAQIQHAVADAVLTEMGRQERPNT